MHPDKLRDFSDATKAFQAITQAFERLSNPEQFADEEEETKGKPKTKKLARSNEGCRRTDVLCPRCKVKWSASALEGNPDYFYNFMMMGLKTFNCATCLFEFGCMSAVHKCPFCRKQFEYSPQDYHRRITCGNGTCTKEFGFHMFNASERVMKELRATIKADHDKRVKRVEQKRRRAESNKRRGIGVDSAMSEEAFCLGLADECPRCGRPLKEFRNEEGQRLHLRDCNDTREHAAHAAKKAAAMTQQEEREKGADAQQEAQAAAAWQFLGGNTEQLWMLTDGALQTECENAGITAAGGATKDEMIAQLAEKKRGASAKKRSRLTAESLPTNWHSLSLAQLKSVCAAHGIAVPAGVSKQKILSLIDEELMGNGTAPLRLESGAKRRKAIAAAKPAAKKAAPKPKPKKRRAVVTLESGSESGSCARLCSPVVPVAPPFFHG